MKNLCWIRRDLRLNDHHALAEALESGETTLLFVFDRHILDQLPDKSDRRITFIMDSLKELEAEVHKHGSSLLVRYGDPETVVPQVAQELKVGSVFINRDYEPYAKERDSKVEKALARLGIRFNTFKDSVYFEKHEVLTGDGGIYKVFTPYMNRWLEKLRDSGSMVPEYLCDLSKLRKFHNRESIIEKDWFNAIGFVENAPLLPGGTTQAKLRLSEFSKKIANYTDDRNFPSRDGTSLLSIYLRFGNISIRDLIRAALAEGSTGSSTWLSELIWRDFYQMILDVYPHVTKGAFKREYDQIKFVGKPEHFEAWCEGRTGFPLIDAAMRCLNETGLMHNRLRMVVASFLCKTLLIDWRLGERYFAEKLLDYDLAANNGGWQWAASTGSDAQPYFRIFNPYTQSEKFDPHGDFIRDWCFEIADLSENEIHRPDPLVNPDYPAPIVSYEVNRERALRMYSVKDMRNVSSR